MLNTFIKASLVMFTSVVSLLGSPSLAAIKGDVELLKTVALKHKANLESIRTLKGEAFEEGTSTIGDWYEFMVKNKCTFAYDHLRDAVRWNKEPQESRCLNHGKPVALTEANYNSTMFKDRTYFNYSGSKQPNDKSKVVYNLVIGEPAMAKGDELHCLDPRYFLSHPAGPTVHDRLMLLYGHANDEAEVGRSVTQEGNLVTLQYSPPDEIRTSRELYDLAAGGNLLEYYSKTPRVEITKNCTYEEKSGVWVLKSYAGTIINYRKDGEISKNSRMINWTNSVVNVPFKEDEFTLDKLGVKAGARVSDHRIKKVYRYEGILPEAPSAPKALMGKRLPELKTLGITTPPADANDKMILVCFWDMNQRPSRNCMQQLSKKAEELKAKGVVVLTVQASKVDQNTLDEWVKKNNVPFPVGMVQGDEEKTRFAWGVKSLPWLILTNAKRIVRAEGFGLGDLDKQLK